MRQGLLLGGLVAAGGIWLAATSLRSSRSPWAAADPTDLPTVRVTRGRIVDSTVAIGTLQSEVGAEVKVGSRLSGVVTELRVNVGDRVEKGDLLARLDDADWRARVSILEAELASGLAEQEFAAAALERAERLGDLLSASERDDAERNLRVRDADVERRRASLAEARLSLGYATLRAPVAGTIASVSTNVGETVAASFAAPTFVTIIDLSRLEVRCFVDETDIGRVRLGQKVALRVDAFAGQEFDGVVRAVYPKAQLVNNVVNYVVIVDLADTRGLEVRPEMTVHADFVLEERDGVLIAPRSSILVEGGRSHVVVRENSAWVKRVVRTGLATTQRIEIVEGVVDGDEIVADKQAWQKARGGTS